jgi:hypothetical protein
MMFNATFNNISVISWQSENQRPVANHIMLYRVNLAMNSIQLTTIAQVVVNPTTI